LPGGVPGAERRVRAQRPAAIPGTLEKSRKIARSTVWPAICYATRHRQRIGRRRRAMETRVSTLKYLFAAAVASAAGDRR